MNKKTEVLHFENQINAFSQFSDKISPLNKNLLNSLKNDEMNCHKTLKDPSESWRRCRFTQLIWNGLFLPSQSLSKLSLTQIVDQQTQRHEHS